MQVLIQILLCHFPEQIRIADRGKNIMRLHAVIPVIRPQLKKFRKIPVPGVQINRSRTLPHTQLIHGNSGVIHQLDPPDHAACRTLKTADGTSRGTYLPEVKPHAAPEFAHLGEIIHTAVNPVKAVGNRIDKAAGELMIGLARIGKSGSSHRDLHAA